MRRLILFFKANPYHDRLGRFTFAPTDGRGGSPKVPATSADITNLAEARAYWRKRFTAGRHSIDIAFEGRSISSAIMFEADNDHAFTEGEWDQSGRKTKRRYFSLERAQKIDAILDTIKAPERVLELHGSQLFVAAKVQGVHYLVVLRWREAEDAYEFETAHPLSVAELVGKHRRGAKPSRPKRRKNEAPLRKSGASPAFLVFWRSETGQPGAFQRPPGDTSRVAAWPSPDMAELASLFKAIPPDARWITVRRPTPRILFLKPQAA